MLNADAKALKDQILNWMSRFQHFAFYDSCEQDIALGAINYDWIAAAGAEEILEAESGSFSKLQAFQEKNRSWIFGGFCYELKNELENLSSEHPLLIDFPRLFFFVPKHIIYSVKGKLHFLSNTKEVELIEEIRSSSREHQAGNLNSVLKPNFRREQYIADVRAIREHIRLGDIYEMNYCVSFRAENVNPEPLELYRSLRNISPAPFSALFRWKEKYLISASPERFLMKKGRKLLSQPIKGTARRSSDKKEDEQIAASLRSSEKERAENVMIVDLVRNDLSRSCAAGTVRVDELFGIYSFPAVHQMISSVSGLLKENESPFSAIAHAFPMGSMTGAPKVMSMKLIEKYENTARGLYSGSVGYITPELDFDFNVVIRSIIADREWKKLAFHVGSAITYDSDPEQEYEECMLKAKAMKTALEGFGIRAQD